MRQMVFEIVDGRAMPRLPRKPRGSFLSLEQAAVATGHTVAALRQQYEDTYGEILQHTGQATQGPSGAGVAAGGGSASSPMAWSPGDAREATPSAIADGRDATCQPSPSPGPAADMDRPPPPAGSGTEAAVTPAPPVPLDLMKLHLAHALHFSNLTEDQFDRVQHFAASRGFDLLSRHVWAEVRWDDRAKTEKLFIGLTIEGLRSVAHRTGQYAGSEPTRFTLDADGMPELAIATVHRLVGGQPRKFTGEAVARELMTAPGEGDVLSFRKQAPRTWLSKCAQAAALRDAFPNELGGVYTPEEMIRTLRQMRSMPPGGGSGGGADESRPNAAPGTLQTLANAGFGSAEKFLASAHAAGRSTEVHTTGKSADRDEPATTEDEVTSPRSFEMGLIGLGVATAEQRRRILQLARLRLPDLANLDDDAAFYAMAWHDVTRYPQIYGVKHPARAAG